MQSSTRLNQIYSIADWVMALWEMLPHSNEQKGMSDDVLQMKLSVYITSLTKRQYPADFYTYDSIVSISEEFKWFPELKELIDFFNPKFKRVREKQQLRLANENDAQRFRFARTIEEANQRADVLPYEEKSCYEWWVKKRVDEGWSNKKSLAQMGWIIRSHRNLEKLFFPWVKLFGERPEDYLQSASAMEVQREKRMHTPQERDQIIQSIKAKYSFRAQ